MSRSPVRALAVPTLPVSRYRKSNHLPSLFAASSRELATLIQGILFERSSISELQLDSLSIA